MNINDKVVCINCDELVKLELYQIYTIKNILTEKDNVRPQILLFEIDMIYYKLERFISLNQFRKQKLNKLECQKFL